MEYFARNFFYNGSEPVFILTRKEIVVINGRKWADWRFVPMLKGAKDYRNNPVYTSVLINSYKGQLLEITFTANLNTESKLKEEIDHIMDCVRLEE